MSSVLPYLLKQYKEVLLETNPKGIVLFGDDPRFKAILHFDPFLYPRKEQGKVVKRHWRFYWDDLFKDYEILNFAGTLEEAGVVSEFSENPDIHGVKDINFYESCFERAAITMPSDFVVTNYIHFSNEEIQVVEKWANNTKDSFKLLVAIGGSTLQKVFPTWMPKFCKKLVDDFPKMRVYLVGDYECASGVWDYERTYSYVNGISESHNIGFKQVYLMTKYVDYVLGGETGLLVGAGHWGTPKTMLCTTSAIDQCVKYHNNDFSLQSQAKCSPCYMSCYTGNKCEKEKVYNTFPICTDMFDLDKLYNSIEGRYREKF